VPLFAHGDLRLGEIAEHGRLSKQAMTGLVKRCEQDGLVTRRPDPADGRAFRISLTERGLAFQAVAEEALAELDELLVRALGTRRHDALIDALRGVMDL
jgi:DNA-binding MarR family transcriptional regulator